jgi:hypothetical protein
MTNINYSLNDFTAFMDMVGNKGIINPATASTRKISASQVLKVLEEEEKADLRKIVLDDVFTRFANLHSAQFTPGSLKTYKSRTKSALEDFLSWKNDPTNFKPSISSKKPRGKVAKKESGATIVSSSQNPTENNSSVIYPTFSSSADAIPIRIRPDVVVNVMNVPHDLTSAEAQKIARVMEAHACVELKRLTHG